jgi:phosphoglycerate dehydrogenase-like enzyme
MLELRRGVGNHELILASSPSASNLSSSPEDPLLADADIAFGQPLVSQLLALPGQRWVHLSSAGYTLYDRPDLRLVMQGSQSPLTTSSGVYDEPCAQHVLAMMMAFARQLPQSLLTQWKDRGWPAPERREHSFLLGGQTAVLCGYGEIGKRLAELLSPFQMKLIGVRRQPRGNESIPILGCDQLSRVLPEADHVINMLPSNNSTDGMFGSELFSQMKPGAYFYNIGRGATVHQDALLYALNCGQIAGAYLDVTTPEPLPVDSPLWSHPNCFITPHTAGGFKHEMHRLVEHFLMNLRRWESGESLANRVI